MAASARRPPGRILTFYSYKGGTGRSMALANVAWILACNGKRVLMMDWDLEAPGLHRYFKPFLIDAELTASGGVIDLLDSYTTAATRAIDPEKPPPQDWHLEYADLTEYVLSINFDQFGEGGKLDFLPAGRQTDTYALKVSLFDWKNFYTRLGGGGFIDAIRDFARTNYDYVLVDSRTGVSDTSGICSVQLPDSLVVCFTYNNQSIKGADAVARSAAKLRKKVEEERAAVQQTNASVRPASSGTAALQDTPLPYRIFPVAMRVDTGESDRLALRQAFARQSFGDLVEHVGPSEIPDYWAAVEVPQRSFYSYEEVLAPFKDDGADPKTILAAFVRLTRYLTDRDITEYRLPIAPTLKQAYLDAYAETPLTAKAAQARRETQVESEEDVLVRTADVAVAMLPEDEKLAAWRIFGRLVRVGLHEEGGGYSAIRANVNDFSEQEVALVSQLAYHRVLSISSETARARSKSRNVQSSPPSDQQTVGFRDERLVKVWKPLIEHLEADEDFLVWRQQLRGYLVDWERSQRERSALLSGTLLAEARRWKSLRPESLNAAETDYIAAARRSRTFVLAGTGAFATGIIGLVFAIGLLTSGYGRIREHLFSLTPSVTEQAPTAAPPVAASPPVTESQAFHVADFKVIDVAPDTMRVSFDYEYTGNTQNVGASVVPLSKVAGYSVQTDSPTTTIVPGKHTVTVDVKGVAPKGAFSTELVNVCFGLPAAPRPEFCQQFAQDKAWRIVQKKE